MQRRKKNFPIVIFLIIVSLTLLFLSKQGILSSVPFINSMLAPLQRGIFMTTQQIVHHNNTTAQLQEENNTTVQAAVQYKKLQEDIVAFRDQFGTTKIPPSHLVPAHIIGEPGFIPGKTAVEEIIIDQGMRAGIKPDMAVVYKNNLVGKVVKTTNNFSQVLVVSNKAISFSAKTLTTNALGVIKGQGNGDMLLDNVLLNQNLKVNDIVMVNGSQNMQGEGYPANLIVGKITGIEKDPSALFQKASVASFSDITKLPMVFVLKITN